MTTASTPPTPLAPAVNYREQFLTQVRQERSFQDAKYGIPHPERNYLAILMEEVGEVASCHKEPSAIDRQHLVYELCQVAASATQYAEFLMAQIAQEEAGNG